MRKLISIINHKILNPKSNKSVESDIYPNQNQKKFIKLPERRQKLIHNHVNINLKSFENDHQLPILLAKSNLSGDQFFICEEKDKLRTRVNSYGQADKVRKNKQKEHTLLLQVPQYKQIQITKAIEKLGNFLIPFEPFTFLVITILPLTITLYLRPFIALTLRRQPAHEFPHRHKILVLITATLKYIWIIISIVNQQILYKLYRQRRSQLKDISFEENVRLCVYLLCLFVVCLVISNVIKNSELLEVFVGDDQTQKADMIVLIQKIMFLFMSLIVIVYLGNFYFTAKDKYRKFNYDHEVIKKVTRKLVEANKLFNSYGYTLTCDVEMTWILLRQMHLGTGTPMERATQFQDHIKDV